MECAEEIKSLRTKMGWSRKEFSEYFKIPIRTLEDWEMGKRKPPEYVIRLLAYQVNMQVHSRVRDTSSRNVSIIEDLNGQKVVLINDKKFRGLDKKDWDEVEKYLSQYVGTFYEIAESAEKIYIDKDMPDEYANSKERILLKGANRKAKANATQGIPELIQIAQNPQWEENREEKHNEDAKYGWYRYEVRFALPIYDDRTSELLRYNIFSAKMLVRHDSNNKKYLYDFLTIKKRNEQPALE